ncbi:hypothetical protein JHK87_004762 [Glycine soja]|nr:hypothetical protein JHK87_004762 [Glycine soja]
MAKNEMKIIGVVIMTMILFGFSQANYNPSFEKIGPNHMSDGIVCRLRCENKCKKFLIIPPGLIFYLICYHTCYANCHDMPIDAAHDCITSCGLTKPVDFNNDAPGLATDRVNSCLVKCYKK